MGDIDLGSLLFWVVAAWAAGLRPSRFSLRDMFARTPRTDP